MDAEEIVHRQREGLAKGRAKVNARRSAEARTLRVLVADLAAADAQSGKRAWGRAGRIRRKLRSYNIYIGERLVRKILSAIQHRVADSLARNSVKENAP